MSTTSIRLPPELKERVARAAEKDGTTPHAFILQAIEEKAESSELQADFHAEADRRLDAIRSTGKAIGWGDAKRYLVDRAAGARPAKPRARKLER